MKNIITGGVNIWHEIAEDQDDSLIDDELENALGPRPFFNWLNFRSLIALIYILLGLILLCFILIMINVYLIHLKVESAVVSVPIEAVVSPLPGYIKDVNVVSGGLIKKGAVLIRIENIDLERDLRLAEVQVEESKINVFYLQTLLNNERQRLAVYKNIGSNRLVSAQAMVDISKHKLITMEKNIARMNILHKKHYVSDLEYDLMLEQYQTADKNVKSTMAQRDIENDSLNAVAKGVYFTGNKLEGIERDLTAEIEIAGKRLKLNEDRVAIYSHLLSKLTLVAPFDCKVDQILKSAGNTTDNAKPLLLLERLPSTKTIIAYLTQAEVSHVIIGDDVKIYIPSIDSKYRGRVLRVNRTEGFVDEMKAQFRWRDFDLDRSAMVLIELAADKNQSSQAIMSGMPAIVYFKRKFTTF